MWKSMCAAVAAAILAVAPADAQTHNMYNGYSPETLAQMRQQLATARSLLERAQRDYASGGGDIAAIDPAWDALRQAERNVREYERKLNEKATFNAPENHERALPPYPRPPERNDSLHYRVMEVVKGKIREHVLSKDPPPKSKWCTNGKPTAKMPKCTPSRSRFVSVGVRG